MEKESLNNIEKASNLLSDSYLFNPTKKKEHVNELIKRGFTEEEARLAFKKSAQKYYNIQTKYNNENVKSSENILKSTAEYTVGGMLTFIIGPIFYIILCLIVLKIIFFVFNL